MWKIGGFFAYYSTTTLWNRQLEYKKKNILNGFLWELGRIAKRTEILHISQRQDPFNPRQENAPNTTIEIVDTIEPFYSENGLFYTFRQDIFNLSPELFEALSDYYDSIIEAEIFRKKLPTENLNSLRFTEREVGRSYTYMLDQIKESEKLIDGLIFDLRAEIGKIDKNLNIDYKDTITPLLLGIIILLLIGYFSIFFGISPN
jgi:hypothetical protein